MKLWKSRVAFFIACDNGIFRSDDGGKSWKHVFVEDGVASLVEVDGVLIGSGFRNLLRSTDNGAHWEKVEIGEWAPFHTALIEDGVVAITFGRERDDQDIVNRLLFPRIGARTGNGWIRPPIKPEDLRHRTSGRIFVLQPRYRYLQVIRSRQNLGARASGQGREAV
ncbi:MAG: hypothetical protein IPJ40_13535 [Saprospirales bacterium]|nr:hypothetical protein [Saprospirales bacterium]